MFVICLRRYTLKQQAMVCFRLEQRAMVYFRLNNWDFVITYSCFVCCDRK